MQFPAELGSTSASSNRLFHDLRIRPGTPASPKRDASTASVMFGGSLVRVTRSAAALTPRYKSAAAATGRNVARIAPATEEAPDGGANVADSGSEYGDINDADPAGEEVLERIDERALRAFPVAYLVFNVAYWCNYLLRSEAFWEDMEAG